MEKSIKVREIGFCRMWDAPCTSWTGVTYSVKNCPSQVDVCLSLSATRRPPSHPCTARALHTCACGETSAIPAAIPLTFRLGRNRPGAENWRRSRHQISTPLDARYGLVVGLFVLLRTPGLASLALFGCLLVHRNECRDMEVCMQRLQSAPTYKQIMKLIDFQAWRTLWCTFLHWRFFTSR